MRKLNSFSWILNVILLIALSILAKDNLTAELKDFFAKETKAEPILLPKTATIEVAFSPNKGATAAIMRALATARTTILVSAYSFTSKEIAEALLDAKKRNVLVKLILDKSQISDRYSAQRFFSNQGFDVRIDIKHAIYHNKFMIIDDNTIITGSFNFTKAAETRNAENIVIIRNHPQLARLYSDTWVLDWNQSISPQDFLEKKARKRN